MHNKIHYKASNGIVYSSYPESSYNSCAGCAAEGTSMCSEILNSMNCVTHNVIWLLKGDAQPNNADTVAKVAADPLDPIKRAVKNYTQLSSAIEAAGGDAAGLLSNSRVEQFLATLAQNGITITATYTKD